MTTSQHVDIVFDGPPGPESGRFVEVENAQGRSINFGEWVQREDGYWVLRIQPAASEADKRDDAIKGYIEQLKHANAAIDGLRQDVRLLTEQKKGEIWRWQSDGSDHLESMAGSMGIVISAGELRALLGASEAGAVAVAKVLMVFDLMKSGRLTPDTREGWEAALRFYAAPPSAPAAESAEPAKITIEGTGDGGPHEARLLAQRMPTAATADSQGDELSDEDAARLHYRGNTIRFVYDKVAAKHQTIMDAWNVLKQHGYAPDGETSLVDMIDRALSRQSSAAAKCIWSDVHPNCAVALAAAKPDQQGGGDAERIRVGAQLANVAFNWSQHPGKTLTTSECQLLRNLCDEWDAARAQRAAAQGANDADKA